MFVQLFQHILIVYCCFIVAGSSPLPGPAAPPEHGYGDDSASDGWSKEAILALVAVCIAFLIGLGWRRICRWFSSAKTRKLGIYTDYHTTHTDMDTSDCFAVISNCEGRANPMAVENLELSDRDGTNEGRLPLYDLWLEYRLFATVYQQQER